MKVRVVRRLSSWAMAAVVATSTGCTAGYHAAQVRQAQEGDALTVGRVQREIRIGMSGAEVAAVLGAPNIVSTDELRREVWIYDRVATETVYSDSSGGLATLVLGGLGGGGVLAGGAGGVAGSAGARSTTQRTITVIIKFDENKRVRDFAYHTSRF